MTLVVRRERILATCLSKYFEKIIILCFEGSLRGWKLAKIGNYSEVLKKHESIANTISYERSGRILPKVQNLRVNSRWKTRTNE